MKIAILTTKNQWFESYADALSEKLGNISIFNNHVDISNSYDIIFILSYHEIILQYWMKSTGESASKVTNGTGIKHVLECLV